MIKILGISGGLILLSNINQQVSLNSSNDRLSLARHAVCYLFPKDELSQVQGVVSFTQETFGARTKIAAVVRGLKPNSLHGLHIHEYGDFQIQGQIYNPFNKRHGSPQDQQRKVGNLGNIKTDERGNGYLAYEDSVVQLNGEHSVIGRSVCVKANEDDLGRGGSSQSSVDGNAGNILATGIIGLTNQFKNIAPYQ